MCAYLLQPFDLDTLLIHQSKPLQMQAQYKNEVHKDKSKIHVTFIKVVAEYSFKCQKHFLIYCIEFRSEKLMHHHRQQSQYESNTVSQNVTSLRNDILTGVSYTLSVSVVIRAKYRPSWFHLPNTQQQVTMAT